MHWHPEIPRFNLEATSDSVRDGALGKAHQHKGSPSDHTGKPRTEGRGGFTIATFNVNSIKARLEIVAQWLQTSEIDVLLLQETKTLDADFPAAVFEPLGYQSFFHGQKTYNGVAVLVKRSTFESATLLSNGISGFPDDQARVIALDLTPKRWDTSILVASLYCPNGQAVGSQKYLYKLDWMGKLSEWVKKLVGEGRSLIFAGDMNVAPSDSDVWNPASWEGNILVSEPERNAYRALLACGLVDTWTLGEHAPKTYSWWDYRASGFEKNHGLRIDHVFVTPDLAKRVVSVEIDKEPRAQPKPSDHTPVVATFR